MTKPTTHTVHDGQTASGYPFDWDGLTASVRKHEEGLIPMSDRVVPGAREALPDEVRTAMLAVGKEFWADKLPATWRRRTRHPHVPATSTGSRYER